MLVSWTMSTAAALLVVSLASATEHGGAPVQRFMGEEHSYTELDGAGSRPGVDDGVLRNMPLSRTFTSVALQKNMPKNILIAPKWIMPGPMASPLEDTFDLTSTMMKRIPLAPKPRPAKPKIQKLKNKNLEANVQGMCYFKVCVFRPATGIKPRRKPNQ